MKVVCLDNISDTGVELAIEKGKIYDVKSHFVRDNEEYFHLTHCHHEVGVFRCKHFRVIEK